MLLSTKYDGMPRKLPSFAFSPDPGSTWSAADICRTWTRGPSFRGIPDCFERPDQWNKRLTEAVTKSTMTKILIVEDDDFLADLMRDCLAASSYDVSSVGTGVEALQQLESESFTIVLLDWQLPDMEGLDVLKTYKEKNGKAKVVMLTGMRGRKDDVMESGADGFLTKPVKMNDILATVKQLATGA